MTANPGAVFDRPIKNMRRLLSLLLLLVVSSIPVTAQVRTDTITATNLENIVYPFEVDFIDTEIQGEKVKLAFMDVRPERPNGKVVLLLHGKNFNGSYWEQTAKDLSQQGFRVVIPDQLGFGKSTKPLHIQYSFHLLATNTRALLDSLNIPRVAVVGHSMGGMLATRFALMFPGITEKLVMVNPIGLEDWKLFVPYQTVDEWYQGELKQNYAAIKKYQLEFYYGNRWKPDYERWVLQLAGWYNNIEFPRLAMNSALLYDMIFTQPVVYEFDKLKAPTLLIIGQRDRTALGKNKAPAAVREQLGNYPKLGKLAATRIPNAELVELDDVGHLPHIEAYDRFINPLLRFLKD